MPAPIAMKPSAAVFVLFVLCAFIATFFRPGVASAQNGVDLPRLPQPVIVAEALGGKLVRLQDEALVAHELDPERTIDHFLLFYSAAWNPACVKFTPALVQFYNEQKAAGANFEIIFVSGDDSEEEMRQHMADTKMPWPALRFTDKGAAAVEFVNAAAGRGVPCLAALDSRGLILVHSYKRRKDYLGVENPLKEFGELLDKMAVERRGAAEDGAQ